MRPPVRRTDHLASLPSDRTHARSRTRRSGRWDNDVSKMTIKERRDGRAGARQAVFYALRPGKLKPERIRINVPPGLTDAAAARWAENVKRAIERGEPVPQLRSGRKAIAEAKAARERQEEEAAQGAITVAEWAERYLADCAVRRVRRTTIKTKRTYLKHLLAVAGSRRVADFCELDWQRLRRALVHLEVSSANVIQKAVATVLRAAHKAGLRGPVETPAKIRREAELADGEEENERPEHYTVEEYERLVAAARQLGDDCLAAVLLGGDAGLRCGEIAGIKVSDLEPGGTIHIRRTIVVIDGKRIVHLPKSGKGRRVPASDRLLDVLARLCAESPDGWVMRARGSGGPAQPKSIAHMVGLTCEAAGFAPTGPHKLRHTYATHQIDAGTSLKRVQLLLGHASITMTERYVHGSGDAADRGAVDRLAQYRSAQAGTAGTRPLQVVAGGQPRSRND